MRPHLPNHDNNDNNIDNNNNTIFNGKNRYAHKAGFMRHKPPQELVQEAYAEGLCGWLMRGLVRSAYAEYKALCGPLMRTTAKFQN